MTGRPEMISEFQAGGGIAQTFDAVRASVRGPISYAVIGLGTGSLTCQARPEDSVTYYELDPDVIRIARDRKLFNFVSECRPTVPIVQGDARLTIANVTDGSYDLIFVDAFFGAAIAIHLLTGRRWRSICASSSQTASWRCTCRTATLSLRPLLPASPMKTGRSRGSMTAATFQKIRTSRSGP